MSDEKETGKITVPLKLINTKNVLIFTGVVIGIIGIIVLMNHKSNLAKVVKI